MDIRDAHIDPPSPQSYSTHPMVIRSKAGICKPKILLTHIENIESKKVYTEPSSLKEDLFNPHGYMAM